MLTMNDLTRGVTVMERGEPWVVVSADHMKKSQRAPVMRTKLRNIRTGRVLQRTYMQGEAIEEAPIEKRTVQFLYARDGRYTFMHPESFEQMELTGEQIGDGARFLRDGMEVDALLFEGQPVAIHLPVKVELRVVSAAPGVRGDSASNIMKDATLEGGIRIQVPLFVREGDTVRVDTRTGTYVERVSGGGGTRG